MVDPERPANPYAGPRALGRYDQIFGRDREIEALLDLLIAERIVLLYSPAGAGKTSLIEAKGGLRERLRNDEGFRVLPVIRVGTPPADCVDWPSNANRFLMSAMRSLEDGVGDPGATPAELTGTTFSDYLARHEEVKNGKLLPTILIFDQFEEILTVDYLNQAARLEFFQQVGFALRERNRWALFSMREDYFPALDAFARAIPTRLSNTFRLHLLAPVFAREAIEGPAKSCEVTFQSAAVDKLVHDLSQVWVQDAEGRREQQSGEEIEPEHLQLFCARLWQRRAEKHEVTVADIEAELSERESNAVDAALGAYYSENVRAAASDVKEVVIRQWIERYLILGSSLRNQIPQEKEITGGLRNEVIGRLKVASLVRLESRRNTTWIELAHDRLIKPILENNASWFRQHHSLLQRQADLWKKQARPDSLCFRGPVLADARGWAAQHKDEVRPVDEEFLARCVRLRDKTRRTWLYGLTTVLLVFAITTTSLAVRAHKQATRANAEAKRANAEAKRANAEATRANAEATRANELEQIASSRALAGQAVNQLKQNIDLAMLLAVEAHRRSPTPEARGSLITAAFFDPRLQYILHGHRSPIAAAAFSPDGNYIAAGDWNSSVLIWDVAQRTFEKQRGPFNDVIRCVVFSPNGKYVAAGSKDGQLALWTRQEGLDHKLDLGEPKMLITPRAETSNAPERDVSGKIVGRDVWAAAFSPDSKWLASTGENGQVLFWDVATQKLSATFQTRAAVPVRALAFNKIDGESIVAGANKDVYAYRPETFVWFRSIGRREQMIQVEPRRNIWRQTPENVHCLAISPNGSFIAAAATGPKGNPIVRIRDTNKKQDWSVEHDGGRVASMSFDATSRQLLLSSDAGVAVIRVATGKRIGDVVRGHTGRVNAVASQTQGSLAVSGAMDGKLIVWNFSRENDPSLSPESNVGETSLALSPDGATKAVGFANGEVIVSAALKEPASNQPRHSHSSEPAIAGLAFSRNGRFLVSASAIGNFIVRELEGTGPPQMFNLSIKGVVSSVAVSDDGRMVAAGTGTGTIYVNDIDRARVDSFVAHENSKIWSLEFSRDGKYLLSGAHDDSAVVWSVDTRVMVGEPLHKHTGSVRCAVFSADDRLIATGSADNTVLIWNRETQRPVGPNRVGHGKPIVSVAFSPDSMTLASSGEDAKIFVWDINSSQPLGEPLASGSRLTQLRFLPQLGRALLLSATATTRTQQWDLAPDALEEHCRVRANRNLTTEEWSSYIKWSGYRPTWSNLPEPKRP